MFRFLEKSLLSFRSCFSREAAFEWFVVITVGLVLREDHLGVTSVIRTLLLDPGCYECMLHFFQSTAWDLTKLRQVWYQVVCDSGLACKCSGRTILVGDGVKQSKEAYRMPGVKKLHQESEDSSKAEYIYGHLFGAVGVLAGNIRQSLCIPLRMGIHDGLQAAAGWKGSHVSSASHVIQMIENGYEVARTFGRSIFLLDRYFLTVPAIQRMEQMNASPDGHLLDIVTKAKRNCVAYEKPGATTGKRGRPPKKGKAIHLAELFGQSSDKFTSADVTVYGRTQRVAYLCKDLLWGQKLYRELRFVLVIMDGISNILVSTDTNLEPETIIELYARRFKIESCFREFKQQIGGFGYHFWTLSLGKLNHYKKREEPDQLEKVTQSKDQVRVLKKARSIECFVHLACVAMGLVQMMLLSEKDPARIQQCRYTRSSSCGRLSEATMLRCIRQRFYSFMASSPESFITRIILRLQKLPSDDEAAA